MTIPTNSTTTKPKITGGKLGFIAAIQSAFYGEGQRMHNPGIKYSPSRGFHVESMLTPSDSDVIWKLQCHFFGNTGEPCLKPSDYEDLRIHLLQEMDWNNRVLKN